MSRNRGAVAELTRSAEHEAEWVDFPPTSERPNWARKLLKQGRTAPVAPIPGDKQGPSEENDAAARPDPAGPSAKLRRSRSMLLIAAVLAVLAAGGYFGSHWWTIGRFLVSTDDAYVGAHAATLAAKIPGYIATIPVEDNQRVRAGEVIATIDDRSPLNRPRSNRPRRSSPPRRQEPRVPDWSSTGSRLWRPGSSPVAKNSNRPRPIAIKRLRQWRAQRQRCNRRQPTLTC